MTDEQKRIKSYLEAQGAKLPPAAIVDKVRAAMADLGKAALAVPAARFGERPEPKDQGNAGAPMRSASEWTGLLSRDREALFDRVRRADPLANLERPIEHGMFGPLNWREALLFMRLHDLDHAGQLQKIAGALAASRSA